MIRSFCLLNHQLKQKFFFQQNIFASSLLDSCLYTNGESINKSLETLNQAFDKIASIFNFTVVEEDNEISSITDEENEINAASAARAATAATSLRDKEIEVRNKVISR